jgi:acyl carrier protein
VNTMDRLQETFRTILDDDALVLTDDVTAQAVPSWDSVAHISLMVTIESQFGVRFTDDQLTAFQNVGELREFLDSHATV